MKPIDITYYQKKLELQTASFSLIDHEDAIVATTYHVTQPSGRKLILKISEKDNHYSRELYFLRLLSNKLPIPHIVNTVPPQKDIYGAILMECLPGSLLVPSEITKELAHELGQSLALIHLNRFSSYGDPTQARLSDDPKKHFTFKFEEGLEECKSHLPSNLIKSARKYYDSHLDLLSSVDGPCAVHRDFRPGNLIVHGGKLKGVIDWAGASASFAEEDFCSIEHGDWLKNHKDDFYLGYASIRKLPDYPMLIPFLRFNKAIATIGFLVKRETWNTTDKDLYQFNRKFLDDLIEPSDFSFDLAKPSQKTLIHKWLKQPYISEWIHGVGLQNTLNGIQAFFQGKSNATYWIGFDKETPFAFLITSPEGEDAITLDVFICDIHYLGKGLATSMIQKFLKDQFSHMKRILIDPEKTNHRAIHVYEKVGFKITGEFIASWNPVPHYQMELDMNDLLMLNAQ
jgi:ribosomal protein S18 acetylase RimI-like enzyme